MINRLFLKRVAGVVLLTFAVIGSSFAQVDVSREALEHYLNNLKTLQANFTQTNPNGDVQKGIFYLSRPGKMRLKYAPPSGRVLIADGNFLIDHDKDMEETTQVSLDATPADFLLRKTIRFGSEIKVNEMRQTDSKVYLNLIKAQDPQGGSLTLIFGKHPLQLQEWQLMDQDGNATHVMLENIKVGLSLDPELFVFVQ